MCTRMRVYTCIIVEGCAHANARSSVCVSLSAAPLLPPTGVHAAAHRSMEQPRRRSQGPH
jgi:hypothetical protein